MIFLTVSSSRSLTNRFFFHPPSLIFVISQFSLFSWPFFPISKWTFILFFLSANFRYFHELSFQFLNGLLFPFSNWIFIYIFLLNFRLHYLIGFSFILDFIFFNPSFLNFGYLYGLFCPIFKWSLILILIFKLDFHFHFVIGLF